MVERMTAKLASLVLSAFALLASWRTHIPSGDDVTSLSLMLVSIAPVFVFFGLLSVWFADYFGSFAVSLVRGGYVDSPPPAIAFVWFGYCLLGLPLLAFMYHVVAHGTRTI